MRALISCALLLGAAHSDGEQFIPEGGKTLEEAYGPMAQVDETIPWFDRGLKRIARPQGFFDVRTEENCEFPIELYFVQDETASFADNYKQMKDEELKKAFDTISANHPESTFGVGTHRDIPIWSLGEPRTDYCWAFRLPLSSNWTALYDTYDKLHSTGGGDAPEYQFGSLIAAAQSNAPGWHNPLASRLIVVSTDAQAHFKGDGFNRPEYGLGEYSGFFDEANAEKQCKTQYYPSPKQVKDALTRREAYVAFLVFDGEYNQGGKPIEAWRWFNSYIDQSPEFVANVQAGAKDFWEKLSKIITELEKAECLPATTTPPPTTTTPPPTTTTPPPTTTTPPPTTTTPPPTTTTPPPTTTTPPPTTTTPPPTTTTPPPTTTTPPPTTTTPPPTTTTPPPTTTTPPTTPPTVVPGGTTETVEETEPECPPCPEPGDCPCPAVKIMLRDKPLQLQLIVNNTQVL